MATQEEIVKGWRQVYGKDPSSTDIANVQKFGMDIINKSFQKTTGQAPKNPVGTGTVGQQSATLSISPAKGNTTQEKLNNALSEFQDLTSQEGLSIDMLQKLLTARRMERQPIEQEKQKIRERMVKRSMNDADYTELRPEDAIQAYSRDQNLDITRGGYLDEVLQNTQRQLGDVLTGFADQLKAAMAGKQTEIDLLDRQAQREEAARQAAASRSGRGVAWQKTTINGREAWINPYTQEIKYIDPGFEEWQKDQQLVPGETSAPTLPSGKPMNRRYMNTYTGEYQPRNEDYYQGQQYMKYANDVLQKPINKQIEEDFKAGMGPEEAYYLYGAYPDLLGKFYKQ